MLVSGDASFAVLDVSSLLWSVIQGQESDDLAWSHKDVLEFPHMEEWGRDKKPKKRKKDAF